MNTPTEPVEFRKDIEVMLACAEVICPPCASGVRIVRRDGHVSHKVGKGAYISCFANPINLLMEHTGKSQNRYL